MESGLPLLELFILLALILLNGFFSMSEMALVSSRKNRLQAEADEGKGSYRKALHAAKNPSRYLSTIQVGITLIGTFSGAFGGATVAGSLAAFLAGFPVLAPYADAAAMLIVVAAITFFSIVLGELVPKQLALSRPEKVAAFTVPVLDVCAMIFKPVVTLLSRTTALVLKMVRAERHDEPAVTEEEIRILLEEGEKNGIVAQSERSMVEGVFYLGDRPVQTFMRHRSELTWLDLDVTETELRALLKSKRNLRFFPVWRTGPDDIVGIVSARDILETMASGEYRGIKSLARKPLYVPGTMPALRALEVFKREKVDMLFILDEYGGAEGTLTLEDLVEEIVGVLSSRTVEAEEIVKREDGSYLMGGFVNVDDFFELFELGKAAPEHKAYHTLAGLILNELGFIPKTGEAFTWNGFRFEVVDMDGNRIDKVLVVPPKAESLPID